MTDIVGLKGTKGGKHIVDRFEVQATQVVERLVAAYNKTGHGALALRKQNTAVMLVPPLKLSFRSQRREADNLRARHAHRATAAGPLCDARRPQGDGQGSTIEIRRCARRLQ